MKKIHQFYKWKLEKSSSPVLSCVIKLLPHGAYIALFITNTAYFYMELI